MKKILIIDDNQSVRNILTDILDTYGYEATQAASGAEGIRLQKENPADLVISDLCMPEKSGIDTIEELKAYDPDLRIIAISGGPGSEAVTGFAIYEQMLEAALKVGASITLKKPIPAKELIQNIESLLNETP